MKVYCSHHNQYGICTEEDYYDAKLGNSPSGMVRVQFPSFTQAVPLNTLSVVLNDNAPDDWESEADGYWGVKDGEPFHSFDYEEAIGE